jgi:hypothetical protein
MDDILSQPHMLKFSPQPLSSSVSTKKNTKKMLRRTFPVTSIGKIMLATGKKNDSAQNIQPSSWKRTFHSTNQYLRLPPCLPYLSGDFAMKSDYCYQQEAEWAVLI